MTLHIRPLNRDDRDEICAMQQVGLRSTRVRRPFHEPRLLDELVANLATQPPGWRMEYFLGFEGSELVGSAMYWRNMESDPDKSGVHVDVDPSARGRGYGTQLAEYVEAQLPGEVTLLMGETDLHDEEWADTPEGRWATKLGYSPTEYFTARDLPWPTDPALLDRLDPHVTGYEIRTYVDGLPDELRASYGVLTALVDVDSPSGEIEWSGEPETPEHYQQHLDRMRAGGATLVETVALLGDEVVALTSVVVPPNLKQFINVQSTYVHRAHRGHRLGMAVKVAIERQLLAMELPHPSIRTGNADTNPWMIGINEELGFRPIVRSAELIKRR